MYIIFYQIISDFKKYFKIPRQENDKKIFLLGNILKNFLQCTNQKSQGHNQSVV